MSIGKREAQIRNEVVKDALRRFPQYGLRTIARHILNTNGDLFENNYEKIRNVVRYFAGKIGDGNRTKLVDKTFVRKGFVPMPATWRKVKTDYHLTRSKPWLVVADLHVPFHEPKAVAVTIEYAKAQGVKDVVILGDLQDCEALSPWKTLRRNFNKETQTVSDFLDYLRSEFPDGEIIYKPGNHEYRLPAYYMSHARELADTPLACMETSLGLEERGIEFLDYDQIVYAGKLPMIHGHEIPRIDRSVNPARGLFLKTKNFALCAHCHTTSQHTTRDIKKNLITTWSIGCLCDLSPDYNPIANDWNWGFAIINIEQNGDFEVDSKRILPKFKVV